MMPCSLLAMEARARWISFVLVHTRKLYSANRVMEKVVLHFFPFFRHTQIDTSLFKILHRSNATLNTSLLQLVGIRLRRPTQQARLASMRHNYIQHPWLASAGLPSVPSLSAQDRLLTFIAGNTAAGNLHYLTRDWCFLDEDAHDKGTEVILQCLGYAGVPRTLNAFSTVRRIGIIKENISDDAEGDFTTIDGNATAALVEGIKARYDRGVAMMQTLYGPGYINIRKSVRLLHPALDRWLVEFVHGRLLSRGALTPRQRTLCALSVMSGSSTFGQFKSMIQSCLATGATMVEVRGVLDQSYLIWGAEVQRNVDAMWADFNLKRFSEQWLSTRLPGGHAEILWDPVHNKDLGGCTAATKALWNKITFSPDDPLLSPPTSRHMNHPFLAMLPRRKCAPDDVQRILCMLMANVNSGNLTAVARDWSYLPPQAHRQGMEALLQTALFAGFPKCLNAMATVYQTGVSCDAIDWDEEDTVAIRNRETDPRMFFERGLGLLKEIYTKTTDGLRANLREGHPDLELIIVEFIYGRVLGRPCVGLTAKERELLTLACLTGPPIVFPQLHSHLLGALNVGASPDHIRCILDQAHLTWGNTTQAMVDGFWLDFFAEMRAKKTRTH